MQEYDLYLERLGLNVVNATTEKMLSYLDVSEFSKCEFLEIIDMVANSIKKWTNFGYIGCKKEELEEEIFQEFWVALKELVVFCMRECSNEIEKEFVSSIVYTGDIYRLIGNTNDIEVKDLNLEYSELYVSWDKTKFNKNIYDCLCLPVFWIAAKVDQPDFGFDIKRFDKWYNKQFSSNIQIAKDDEDEVVFSTKESCVLKIRKIKREGEIV